VEEEELGVAVVALQAEDRVEAPRQAEDLAGVALEVEMAALETAALKNILKIY